MIRAGIDIVSISRIARLTSKYGDSFGKLAFSKREWAQYAGSPPQVAMGFAAKEAVSKAIGVGLSHMTSNGIPPVEIEILFLPGQQPEIVLTGRAEELASAMYLSHLQLSTSHMSDLAIAVAILS
jgi:holo-[acyl-carrier protein] synthase